MIGDRVPVVYMQSNKNLPRVAYFCMEYGLDDSFPIYSGGLGILAGDYLKAAHDLGLPLVGIGILWRQDYTEQYIDEHGNPYDVFVKHDFPFLKDTGVTINVTVRGDTVPCRIWLVEHFQNAPLYLLDADLPGSPHGWITQRLYQGGADHRIAQEIILGVGGVRVLRALNLEVDIYHFNESHSFFAGLELLREKMEQGLSFEQAWEGTRRQVVFTTHTPVEAGNEKHPHHLLQEMGAYNGLSYEQMCRLGGDPFNMTQASLRLAFLANAVSQLHGETTRQMWQHVQDKAPITSVTNGVHLPTWQDPAIRAAYDRGEDLWEPHLQLKKQLIEFIRQKTGQIKSPEALLVGFARRAAAYKRNQLIFGDMSVIEPLLKEGKLQLVFSGKAHPDDHIGKDVIRELVRMDRQYENSIVFLENYDMKIARYLVRGCDVWLNNPRRPLEASGTSGMKAAMNGVLNLSVLDGWVCEGPVHGVSGWLLHCQDEHLHLDQDERDLQALYHILLTEVIPTYYENPACWRRMMRASIEMSQWQFSSERMIHEYYEKIYTRAPVLSGRRPPPEN